MTTEQATAPVATAEFTAAAAPQPQPFQAWLARLGLSGKVLAISSLVGLITVFLPFVTMSVDMPKFEMPAPGGIQKLGGSKNGINVVNNAPAPSLGSSSMSVMVVEKIPGVICLLGYIGALVLCFVLYPANGLTQKNLAWVGVGVGGFVVLMGIWLLAAANSGSMSFGFAQISIGIGAILNLVAGLAVTTGGFLKVREEKLI